MLGRGLVAVGGVALLAAPALAPPVPRLAWNVTPSAPIGLYRVEPDAALRDGALVLVHPPRSLARLFAARGYISENVPLLKHIAARPGQRICRRGEQVTIDGRIAALALKQDRRGRLLPVWQGCRELRHGELFVLSPGVRDALDSRYFGPLPRTALVGVATPLWTGRAR